MTSVSQIASSAVMMLCGGENPTLHSYIGNISVVFGKMLSILIIIRSTASSLLIAMLKPFMKLAGLEGLQFIC